MVEDGMPIIIEDDYMTMVKTQTTGGHIWEATRVLFDYIVDSNNEAQTLLPRGGTVLELGSGTGWLGMAIASRFGQQLRRVMLTEMLDGNAFEWLKHNVESNRTRGLPLSAVELIPCDWGWFENATESAVSHVGTASITGEHWDLVIGSDLVYNEAGVRMLPRVLRSLACKNSRILYAHTLFRFEQIDLDFFDELKRVGMRYERVWPADEELPEPPTPMTELFPEQYVAIFSLSLSV